jgi:hypothetical protein
MRKTVSFTRRSANIFFHLLTRCNLRCRHCYINPDQHGRQTLDIDTIDRWLALFAHRHPSPNVIFWAASRPCTRICPLPLNGQSAGLCIGDHRHQRVPVSRHSEPGDAHEVDYFSFSLDGPSPSVNDPLRGDGSFSSAPKASWPPKSAWFCRQPDLYGQSGQHRSFAAHAASAGTNWVWTAFSSR